MTTRSPTRRFRAAEQIGAVLFVTVLTAAAAQISIPLPFTPVPFTFQPMVVLLGAAALGARLGVASQILYLALGFAGLPVFAASPVLPQGAARLLGPTGGYLMAYPFAAFAAGWLAERGFDRRYAHGDPRDGVRAWRSCSPAACLAARYRSAVASASRALAAGFYPFIARRSGQVARRRRRDAGGVASARHDAGASVRLRRASGARRSGVLVRQEGLAPPGAGRRGRALVTARDRPARPRRARPAPVSLKSITPMRPCGFSDCATLLSSVDAVVDLVVRIDDQHGVEVPGRQAGSLAAAQNRAHVTRPSRCTRREIALSISCCTSSAKTSPCGPTRRASRMVNQPLPAPTSATTDASAIASASMMRSGPLPLIAVRRFEQTEILRWKQPPVIARLLGRHGPCADRAQRAQSEK